MHDNPTTSHPHDAPPSASPDGLNESLIHSSEHPRNSMGERLSSAARKHGASLVQCAMRCIEAISIKSHSKYALGVFLIVCVAFIWVGASEWIQYIFGTLNYNKPYFLTFFNTFGFSFWNLGYLFSRKWRRTYATSMRAAHGAPKLPQDDAQKVESSEVPVHVSVNETETKDDSLSTEHTAPERYSMKKMLIATAYFCPLWFIANTLFNYSLSSVSVSTNTILSSSSSVWTLFLSYFLLNQKIKPLHVLAVSLSVAGSVLVSIASSSADSSRSTTIGILAAVLSAAFYAGYTTVLKLMLPDEEKYSMGMVFGILGILNTIVFWPGFFILHLTGLEMFEIPPRHTLWPLAINALIGTNLSDVLWARGVVLTSPLVATLGLSLTIPMAMIFDFVLKSHTFSLMYFSGATVVTAGFTLCNLQ